MSNHLYDNLYAPILSEIGFIECSLATAIDAFMDWQQPIQSGRSVYFKQQEVFGDLSEKIIKLLPLTSCESRRFLFLPTKSRWTAYLDNGLNGPDVFSVVSFLATKIGCFGLRGASIPNTIRIDPSGQKGRYGATLFEVYSKDNYDCSFLNIKRSIASINDGGKWRFDQQGEPLEMENPQWYKALKVRDRFTDEMLDRCFQYYGIQFFSNDFYNVSDPGMLISKVGPSALGLKEYSLEEVRANY